MFLVAGVILLGGVAIFVIGHAAADGKLPRNHIAGIRTRTTMASDEAWVAAHRAAAVMLQAAGAVAILGGVVLLVLRPDDAAMGTIALVTAGAMGVLIAIAAGQGQRAAAAVGPRPRP